MNKNKGKTPIEIIREMNPGIYVPTGEELAKSLLEKCGISEEKKCQKKSEV